MYNIMKKIKTCMCIYFEAISVTMIYGGTTFAFRSKIVKLVFHSL